MAHGEHEMESVPRSPEDDYSEEAIETRRRWLKEKTGVELKHTAHHSVTGREVAGNIENFIGVAQVPVGLAGPLKVRGEHADGVFYVPLATTEGALVASYNRGMKAITESGGAEARLFSDHTQVCPIFVFPRAGEAAEFLKWAGAHFEEIKAVAESTTSHGKLLKIDSYLMGRRAALRFYYSTGDAMGLNMITHATDEAARFIAEEFKPEAVLFPSSMGTDKKSAAINLVTGRGKRVSVDVVLPAEVVSNRLHTTPQAMAESCYTMMVGNAQAGTLTQSMHPANGLTALLMATGQDVAYVPDSAVTITTMEVTRAGDLYVSLYMPSLIVGTVGGGTGLGSFREALEIMGCHGAGKAKKFAEIAAAAVMAGEISANAATTTGEFSQAHNRLGRNRPQEAAGAS
jgi:hydroxymethylglutaryl-CoA reductase (NADPH)